METPSMVLLTLLVGVLVLVLGRRLFWLFVGAVGFELGMRVAMQIVGQEPAWQVMTISLVAGLLGALLAVFLQRAALAIAGFFAGGYLLLGLISALDLQVGQLAWLFLIAGGIIGTIFVFMLFDWALIVLSSLLGAQLLVGTTSLEPLFRALLFVVLVALGVIIQRRSLRWKGRSSAARHFA